MSSNVAESPNPQSGTNTYQEVAMTALCERSPQLEIKGTLAPVLRVAHDSWIRETNEFLFPITRREASFWNRWTAVRYLADQFMGQYRRERALVAVLRPLLAPEVGERLVQQGQRIGALQDAIDRLGRKRGTGGTVLVIGRGLLASLRDWCREIEAAAGPIPREMLPEQGHRLIAELELYTVAHG